MKELDLLKKDWNKEKHPKVSSDSIYKMILKKSSSVVKWIFIISILELGLGLLSGLLYNPKLDQGYNLPSTLHWAVSITGPVIAIYFIFRFYKNYKNINTTNSVKELLNNIITTRRTVKQYVIVNLVFLSIFICIMVFYSFTQPIDGAEKAIIVLNSGKDYFILILAILFITIIVIGFCLFLYFILYGILMRKLNRNYNELKKLDL